MTSGTERPAGARHEPPPGLSHLNALPAGEAAAALRAVCGSTAWVDALLAARPYPSTVRLLAASDAATAALTDAELAEALAEHPPIGAPKPGDPVSAREQRGMAGASDALRERMRELDRAYRSTFGHVFLVCATGLTAEQLVAAVEQRLGNPPERERVVVRTELSKINRIRLTRLVEEADA